MKSTNTKHKITSQLVKNEENGTYSLYWLIDGVKHARHLSTTDRKMAADQLKKIVDSLKKRLNGE